jgi:hypothetical protein
MAEITIRLRHNQQTGRRELVIHLESDSDVLGHEHEIDHRALVEKLLGQPVGADTDLVIERVDKAGQPLTDNGPATTAPADEKATDKKALRE